MRTIQTRFGKVEYDPANLLHFPAGMIGFPTLHDFIVMPNKKKGPLFWIQSIDDGDIAFVLTDPTNFFFDYQIQPDNSEKSSLHIKDDDDCYVLAVVTVPPDQKITLNLVAPVLFAPKTNRAIQVILEKTNFNSKTPRPAGDVKPEREQAK